MSTVELAPEVTAFQKALYAFMSAGATNFDCVINMREVRAKYAKELAEQKAVAKQARANAKADAVKPRAKRVSVPAAVGVPAIEAK